MKALVGALACPILALALSAQPAEAADPYVSGKVGLAMLQDSDVEGFSSDREYDTGYFVGGALGLEQSIYRVELEIGYQGNGLEDAGGDVSILSFLGNGYLDFELPASPIEPYVSAGLGFSSVDDDSGVGTSDDTVFTWQFGAGLAFDVAPAMKLDVGYRYLGANDADLAGGRDYSIDSHNLLVGLRFGF